MSRPALPDLPFRRGVGQKFMLVIKPWSFRFFSYEEPFSNGGLGKIGAEGGIWTHTGLRPLRPERSASAVPPLRLSFDFHFLI